MEQYSMSHRPFSLSSDLRQLRDEGYFVQIKGGSLVMREVPYVDAEGCIRLGAFACSLRLAGDTTLQPDDHVVHFIGDSPYEADEKPIKAHSTGNFSLEHGLIATHKFSRKPPGGFSDYYQLMTTYAAIFSAPAQAIDPTANPRVYRMPENDEESVFNYIDTATNRAETGALADRLRDECIAIIGLGGTGAYVLDFVSKTPVSEIRLFDNDEFEQHNAWRAPGAPSLDELRKIPTKLEYLRSIYSKMHRNIVAHEVNVDTTNLQLLNGATFAFVCIDDGEAKRCIFEKLEQLDILFIDTGMGLDVKNGSLGGIVRNTTSIPKHRNHLHEKRVSFTGGGDDEIYGSNIQIAELNALSATLAVIKWKKLLGFYRDLEEELHCTYTTDGNALDNSVVLARKVGT